MKVSEYISPLSSWVLELRGIATELRMAHKWKLWENADSTFDLRSIFVIRKGITPVLSWLGKIAERNRKVWFFSLNQRLRCAKVIPKCHMFDNRVILMTIVVIITLPLQKRQYHHHCHDHDQPCSSIRLHQKQPLSQFFRSRSHERSKCFQT